MFYKVTTNSELVNTEPLILKEIEVRYLQASGHIFIKQVIRSVALCVFLFKGTLFNIYCWFINIELRANTLTYTWTKFT